MTKSAGLLGASLIAMLLLMTFGVIETSYQTAGAQTLDGDDFPPFPQGSVPPAPVPDPPPPPPATPAPGVTFVPEWLPPPPGGQMCVYNLTDVEGLWTICFPNYDVEYEVGMIPANKKGTLTIPPGSEGIVFKFKVYFEIDGVVVIYCSNVMAVPS